MACPKCGTRPADAREGEGQSADTHPVCAGCGGMLVEQMRIPWWLWLLMAAILFGGGIFVLSVV